MSKIAKLMQQAAAGAAGGGVLNVEDVFSTYLYTGNGSTQTITNGIDLDGEGGLVWIKGRNDGWSHHLVDSERGADKTLFSDSTSQEYSFSNRITSLNSDGFSLGNETRVNKLNDTFASWTFRKAPKFFDVVTYTGDGVAGRTVSHSLGSVPGCIIVKRTDAARNWSVFHRSTTATHRLLLNDAAAASDDANYWDDTEPTETEFTLGTQLNVNASGGTYVAYLFAHNDGDGEFGGEADADIIKCGSYTGNGATDGVTVDLGFEPQWLMFKDTTTNTNDWIIVDNMRGMVVDNDLANADAYLSPNLSNQEGASTIVEPTSTGFKVQNNGWTDTSGANIIYIAIRRGTKVPESGTEVFAMDDRSGGPPNAVSGFPVDMAIFTNKTVNDNKYNGARLIQGKRLYTNLTNAEGSSSELAFDYNTGFIDRSDTSANNIHWMWKRAPNFFDAVAYTGNGTEGRTVSHNLGVAPEMIWVKCRDTAFDWAVYTATTGNNKILKLNTTDAALSPYSWWNYTTPTDSVFTLSGATSVNGSGKTYIAYLFASLAGVSKVGSFSHTYDSGDTNVDCGFSSGARFVIYKQYASSGDWIVLDTERGIVSGTDPAIYLNNTDAEDTQWDWIDPNSSGFTVPSKGVGTGDYIFYAIA